MEDLFWKSRVLRAVFKGVLLFYLTLFSFVVSASIDHLSKTEIQRLQVELQKHGFYQGPVDGIAGKGTKEAAREFRLQYSVAESSPLKAEFVARALARTQSGSASNSSSQPLAPPPTSPPPTQDLGNGKLTLESLTQEQNATKQQLENLEKKLSSQEHWFNLFLAFSAVIITGALGSVFWFFHNQKKNLEDAWNNKKTEVEQELSRTVSEHASSIALMIKEAQSHAESLDQAHSSHIAELTEKSTALQESNKRALSDDTVELIRSPNVTRLINNQVKTVITKHTDHSTTLIYLRLSHSHWAIFDNIPKQDDQFFERRRNLNMAIEFGERGLIFSNELEDIPENLTIRTQAQSTMGYLLVERHRFEPSKQGNGEDLHRAEKYLGNMKVVAERMKRDGAQEWYHVLDSYIYYHITAGNPKLAEQCFREFMTSDDSVPKKWRDRRLEFYRREFSTFGEYLITSL